MNDLSGNPVYDLSGSRIYDLSKNPVLGTVPIPSNLLLLTSANNSSCQYMIQMGELLVNFLSGSCIMQPLYIIKRTKKRYKNRYCYSVINSKSRRVFSKCTTKKKAEKQRHLLYSRIFK